MGRLNGRISKLEGHMPEVHEGERLRITRVITKMVLDEHARDQDLPAAIRRVVEDQYEDLNEESRAYIADSWTENILSWTRLDWMVNAGREGP
jgi:uncharacterized protein (UPF0147 family)